MDLEFSSILQFKRAPPLWQHWHTIKFRDTFVFTVVANTASVSKHSIIARCLFNYRVTHALLLLAQLPQSVQYQHQHPLPLSLWFLIVKPFAMPYVITIASMSSNFETTVFFWSWRCFLVLGHFFSLNSYLIYFELTWKWSATLFYIQSNNFKYFK